MPSRKLLLRPKRSKVSRNIFVDENGEPIKNRPEKKPKECYAGPVNALWKFWSFRLRSIGLPVEREHPMGHDFGHLKNLYRFCGKKLDIAQEVLELLISRWEDIRNSFWRARSSFEPNLHVMDYLKDDLLPIATGARSFPKKDNEDVRSICGTSRGAAVAGVKGDLQEEVERQLREMGK